MIRQSLYSKLYHHLYFGFYNDRLRKRNFMDKVKFLTESQYWSRDELLQFQENELRKLAQVAAKTGYYSRLFSDLNIQPSMVERNDLKKLPILTKEIINENLVDLLNPDEENMIEKRTGGSTGEPLEFFHDYQSYEWRTAVTYRGYSWSGYLPGMRQLYLWGGSVTREKLLARIKQEIHHFILRQKYINVFTLDEPKIQKIIQAINGFKPASIVGYVNPMYWVADYILTRHIELKHRDFALISAAEKLYDYQREAIERAFGAKIFETYGSREFMLIGAECEQHAGLHISEENLILEVVDDEGNPVPDGIGGHLLITDLHNFAMPFMRYRIGDEVILNSAQCTCGRSLKKISKVLGRSLDSFVTRDGKKIPGELFPHLLKEFRTFRKFQVIQHAFDRVEIKFYCDDRNYDERDLQAARKILQKYFPHDVHFEFNRVETFELSRTGKFLVTQCRVMGND